MSSNFKKRPPRQAGHKDKWGGAYFVTFNVFNARRDRIPKSEGPLGVLDGAGVRFSPRGQALAEVWQELPVLFRTVEIGSFVIMPDHFHGILSLRPADGNANLSFKPLGQVIGALKSLSTKRMNEYFKSAGASFWQSGFYDRAIRDATIHARVERYIQNNPAVLRRRVIAYARENGGGGLQPATTIFPGAGRDKA